MSSDTLHYKYAPSLRFARSERFFPMPLEDFLTYSRLYVKGQTMPVIPTGQVRPNDLMIHPYNSPDTFLRSVEAGPLQGAEVTGEWSTATLRMLYKWSQNPLLAWSEEVARKAYQWFSPKTKTATQLFWWNRLLLPWVQANQHGSMRQELPRFKLPLDVRASAIENYETSQGQDRKYTYYYRTVQQGEYLVLQYWFFYSYNDWACGYGGFNDHEGDWEGFYLFFKRDGQRLIEPPAYVCYLGHHSRLTKPWDHPEVEKDGDHPIIYVAAGSHASYPQARQYPLMSLYDLIDYATGESFTLDHTMWRGRIPVDTLPWLPAYRGTWGTRYWISPAWLQNTIGELIPALAREVAVPGVSAPRGPRLNDEGDERETWHNPVAFAGIEQLG